MHPNLSFYIQRLGLQHATFSRIEHEDAIVAIVYKVALPSQVTYILKICERSKHYQNELCFLSHFANRIAVPRIIQTVPPEVDLPGAILMECLPGALLSTQTISERTAHEIGISLATIHAERTTGYGDIGQPGEWRYAHAQEYVAEKFEEAFAECTKQLPQELLHICHNYYISHLSLLKTVDGPCLTHRDFRPANIMVNNDKLQGIIDWSSSRSGFAEEDFIPLESTILIGAGGEWNISQQSKEAFLAGYGTVRAIPDYQTMMPLLQMIRAFFTIGYTIRSGTWHTSGARAYQSSLRMLEKLSLTLM